MRPTADGGDAVALAVPLLVGDGIAGVLHLSWKRPVAMRSEDLRLAEALGAHAAAAIQTARLVERVQRRAETSAERTQALLAALARAATREDVGQVILRDGIAAVGAQSGVVALLVPSGAEVEMVWVEGYPEGAVRPWQRFAVDAPVPLAEAVRTAEPVFAESAAEVLSRYPALADAVSATRAVTPLGALAALPLTLGGRTLGALGFTFAADRRIAPDERRALGILARRCALALDRAEMQSDLLRAAERERLAMDLHDDLMQHLYGAMLVVATAQRRAAGDPGDSGEAAGALAAAADAIRTATDATRALMESLRSLPGAAQSAGWSVGAGLDAIVAVAAAQGCAVRVRSRSAAALEASLPSEARDDALRIIREAISNAVRHGGATAVTVDATRSGRNLKLTVRDDGRGFDPAAQEPADSQNAGDARDARDARDRRLGRGLDNMTARARRLGGTLAVESALGRGTTVCLDLPLGAVPPQEQPRPARRNRRAPG